MKLRHRQGIRGLLWKEVERGCKGLSANTTGGGWVSRLGGFRCESIKAAWAILFMAGSRNWVMHP